MDRQAILHGRHHRRPAGMAKLQGRAGISGEKDLLHRRHGRQVDLNDLIDPVEDFIEPIGKRADSGWS